MRLDMKKAAALASLLILVLAWIGGSLRQNETSMARLAGLADDVADLRQVGEGLFEGHNKKDPSAKVFVGLAARPGYGGPLTVAVVVDEAGIIERVAVLHSTDTSTYLDKVMGQGILAAFPGKNVRQIPNVNAVTGATISSAAIIGGLNQALGGLGHEKFGLAPSNHPVRSFKTSEIPMLLVIVLLFSAVWLVSTRRFPWNKKRSRWAIMAAALITLGFVYGCQFSLSIVSLFLGGTWWSGLATLGPFLVLGLAILIFFITRKNLYCASLCPFGVVQEVLGRITGSSPPPVSRWMSGLARGFALLVLAGALYYRDSSLSVYEPFGMAFNFIGSSALFALAILVVLSSLVFKRPWCRLLCPVGGVFDYMQFMRGWLIGNRKRTVKKEQQE